MSFGDTSIKVTHMYMLYTYDIIINMSDFSVRRISAQWCVCTTGMAEDYNWCVQRESSADVHCKLSLLQKE